MTDSSQDEAARAGSPGTAGSNGGDAAGKNHQEQHTSNSGSTQSIADAANDYFKRGWKPVPISLKTKRPVGMEWQKRPFSPEQFNGKARNVGIQFSPVSGNLVDVDLDSKLVIDLASYFLPDTNAIFGRQSKPASHRFYIADFSGEGKKAAIQFKDGDAMIVELRIGAGGKGAQSVVPPSVHSSGELIQWINDNPTPVDALELKRAVTKLAAACLLVPRYPDLGSRHDAALVLGGVLARANWTANETEHFVRVVAKSADCESWAEHATAAKSAVEAMANGTHISGRKRLVEVWGEDLADTFMKWGIGNKDSEFKTPLSHLPELLIDSGDLTETATQIAGMFAQHRRFLFNGYEPIRVVRENEEMPEAVPITPEAVRVFTHELRTSLKFVRGEKVRTTLSNGIANLYLRGLQGQWGLRTFNGITTAPILDDGSFRTGSGYDEASGLWCHNIPEVNVPEEPTRAQAEASLNALRCFFRTFAFADAAMVRDRGLGVDVIDPKAPIGLDESSFLVSLMTGVCRASLILAPGILANAPAVSGSGTGKGLATKAICITASGAPSSAFTAGHDVEELDKRLTAALMMRDQQSFSIITTPKIGGRTYWRRYLLRTLVVRWGTPPWSSSTPEPLSM